MNFVSPIKAKVSLTQFLVQMLLTTHYVRWTNTLDLSIDPITIKYRGINSILNHERTLTFDDNP